MSGFHHASSLLLSIGLLAGCPTDTGEDDVCTSTLGTVTGTITTDFECTSTATDARVEFVQGTDIPISVRPDEEGRFTIDLDAGSWDVEGFGWADTCITEAPETITVSACETVEVDLCANLCVDG